PDRDVGGEIGANTVEERAPRHRAGQGAILQHAFEIDSGFGQALADEGTGWDIRAEGEIDAAVAARCPPRGGKTARSTIGNECEVLESEIKIEIRRTGGEDAIGGQLELVIGDAEIFGPQSLFAARHAAGEP